MMTFQVSKFCVIQLKFPPTGNYYSAGSIITCFLMHFLFPIGRAILASQIASIVPHVL
jgi:hypothetical protein